MYLLEVSGVSKEFIATRGFTGRRVLHAVRDVHLGVGRGEIVSVVGESGSGKTTLGKCVSGLLHPTSGDIVFDGTAFKTASRAERSELRRRIQPVFQDPRSSLDPRWSVRRTIAEPLSAHRIGTRTQRRTHVEELMDRVGLTRHLAERRPHELSGGQQQRVAIAAALALEPDLLVADEPVSALDVSVQAQILNLLVSIQRSSGMSILFIAHDLAVVEHISDHVAVMYLGRIVEFGTVEDVFERPKHPYTRALIDAIPRPDPALRKTSARLPGEIPSPLSPPSGCAFRTRCSLAEDACSTDVPPMTRFGAGHFAACYVTAREVGEAQVELKRLRPA
jgi:oligopeptide/dipeptide ABC transporter ATP-binding protein